MIITTSYHPDRMMIQKAKEFALTLNGIFLKREKYSLEDIKEKFSDNDIIVIEKNQIKYYSNKIGDSSFYFHPSMATLRIKQLEKGDNDLLVNIAELKEGDSFLDCSLGFGSDAIVASYIVGDKGKVVGIESERVIATIVKDGLKAGWSKNKNIDEAMKRIEVIHSDHLEVLEKLPNKSFDIVYFDPMFRHGLMESSSMTPLRNIANKQPLTTKAIEEAKRIAKRKVILKENIKSGEFERLGFKKIPRTTSITYGIIRGDEKD